jgi:hypothetical protein
LVFHVQKQNVNNDVEHSGHTAMMKTHKNVKLIKEFVHETRCNTISNLANEVGILI